MGSRSSFKVRGKIVSFDHPEFDLEGSLEARDKGILKVAKNSRNWSKRAIDLVCGYPDNTCTGESLRLWLTTRIGEPHHFNVMGAFVMNCIKKGVLIPLDSYENRKTKQSHASKTMIYRVVR